MYLRVWGFVYHAFATICVSRESQCCGALSPEPTSIIDTCIRSNHVCRASSAGMFNDAAAETLGYVTGCSLRAADFGLLVVCCVVIAVF